MLSKQDKLKYGEQLRRQMKQRQQKKRMDDMQKRGIRKSPTDGRIQPESEPYFENKQVFQKRFENQNVDYYGRPGGGAPNRMSTDPNYANMQPQYNQYEQNMGQRPRPNEQVMQYQEQPNAYQNPGTQNSQAYRQAPNQDPQYYAKGNSMQGYASMEQGQYSNAPFAPPSYGQIPLQGIAQQPRAPTDRSFVAEPYQPPPPPATYNPYPVEPYNPYPGPPADLYNEPIQQINQKHDAYRQKTLENEELMQIHKKGGRNLLKLENMTIDQQQIKQKQKEEMRRQLELQMKEVQQRKKEEEERRKREELEEERKNQEYEMMLQRRLKEEQALKNEKQRELIEQNVKNLQQRKRLEEQAKQKALRERNKQQQQNAAVNVSIQNSPKINKKDNASKQGQFQFNTDQTTSQISSSTVVDKAIMGGATKDYFENERRKDQQRIIREKNLEAVTDEIKRLKEQIDQQNQMFLREIQRVKLQSEITEQEKRKAEQQIQNLKQQLKKKMEDDNERLFLALQRQQKLSKQQQQYTPPPRRPVERRAPAPEDYYYPQPQVQSLKPSNNQRLVKKQYAPQPQPRRNQNYNTHLQQSNVSQEGGMLTSLQGESKRIPINLPDKLTMSKLSDFATQTVRPPNGRKTNYRPSESIVEEQQDKADSRVVPRKPSNFAKAPRDELDRYVQTKQNEKGASWGELSSVNSDITKQIQQLLRKKDQPYRPPSSTKYDYQERPSSHLSNAGKRALSRGGLTYEGGSIATINSNNGQGTLDIDAVHNRNDRRLNQLRNLGVETINTNNGDDEFSKLDMILNKYKQSRVL